MSDFLFLSLGGGGGVWKVMLKEKGGSAKIKQAIFHIAPAPPLSINNDRSLTSKCEISSFSFYSWVVQ